MDFVLGLKNGQGGKGGRREGGKEKGENWQKLVSGKPRWQVKSTQGIVL